MHEGNPHFESLTQEQIDSLISQVIENVSRTFSPDATEVRAAVFAGHDEYELLREYARFTVLARCWQPRGPVAPSMLVDAVWHHHLANSESYAKLCSVVLNMELQHVTREDDPLCDNDAIYADTIRAYRETYGVWPPEKFWTACDGDSTPCHARGIVLRPIKTLPASDLPIGDAR